MMDILGRFIRLLHNYSIMPFLHDAKEGCVSYDSLLFDRGQQAV